MAMPRDGVLGDDESRDDLEQTKKDQIGEKTSNGAGACEVFSDLHVGWMRVKIFYVLTRWRNHSSLPSLQAGLTYQMRGLRFSEWSRHLADPSDCKNM